MPINVTTTTWVQGTRKKERKKEKRRKRGREGRREEGRKEKRERPCLWV